jgi:hypothetical protein
MISDALYQDMKDAANKMVASIDAAIREGAATQLNRVVWESVDEYVRYTSRAVVSELFQKHGRDYIRQATLDTVDRLLNLEKL